MLIILSEYLFIYISDQLHLLKLLRAGLEDLIFFA